MRTVPTLLRLEYAAAIAVLVAMASTAYAQKTDGPKPDEMVLRTYEVGDLVVTVPDYSLETGRGAGPVRGGGGYGGGGFGGGGMGGGGGGGGGMFSVADEVMQASGRSSITTDSLTQVIMETVAPDSWLVNGGGDGRVAVLGTTIVVRQTTDVHEAIGHLLGDLRNGSATRRTVAIDARWLLLDSDDLEQLVVAGDDGKPKVNRQVLAEFTRRPTSLRGLTSCFSGQSVYLTSGTVRSNVSGYIPVVGSIELPKSQIMFASDEAPIALAQLGGRGSEGGRSVGYQPVITNHNFGVQIELRPTLLHADNAAVIDLISTITFPGTPSNLESLDAPANPLAPKVDRLAIQTQELATTLRVPLGEPVLVGGMTYMAPAPAPAEGESVDVQVQDASAEQRQMYLVVELR